MKIKIGIVILAVACIGLVIALFAARKDAEEQHASDLSSIGDFSNQVVTVGRHLDELGQVNLTLSNDVASSQQQLTLNAEQMGRLSNSVAAANAALADTKSSLASAQEQVTNLNTRITDLEAQNKVLDDQAQSLSNKLVELTVQIDDTKTKLAVALTNADFLQHELQKQMAAKAELEHRFNDLDELRAKVKQIKDQMFIARHEQLMKNDNGGKKGGELLIQRTLPGSSRASGNAAGAYDLNVEVGSDGSVKVIPPLGNTNRVAH
jgi:chromosome segregation ATPase